jgi:hypothetical protein
MATSEAGRVTRLYPSSDHTFIRPDVTGDERPRDGYFRLNKSHSNYSRCTHWLWWPRSMDTTL